MKTSHKRMRVTSGLGDPFVARDCNDGSYEPISIPTTPSRLAKRFRDAAKESVDTRALRHCAEIASDRLTSGLARKMANAAIASARRGDYSLARSILTTHEHSRRISTMRHEIT